MNLRKRSVTSLGLALGLSAFLSTAVSAAPPEPQKKETSKKPGATASASPSDVPIFDSDAIGQKQIVDYQKVAQDSGRRLLLIFGTNECGPCRAFNRAIHEKQFFSVFINQFIPVYVDVSSGTNATLLADFNINPAAEQPGVVILMPDARIVEVLAQGEMAVLARKNDDAVREFFIARFLKTEK